MILGSKKQFVPLYLNGIKKHSFRKGNRWRAGMSIQFFQDTRTKKMKKFMDDKIVVSVQDIKVFDPFSTDGERLSIIEIDGVEIKDKKVLKQLAINDGFKSHAELTEFFFPKGKKVKIMDCIFEGQIVHWTDLRY